MKPPLLYDITRLVTRIFARTPNGIDRVDYAFASHALTQGPRGVALMATPWGPRVIPALAARDALANIRKHWGEDGNAERDDHFHAIVAALDDPAAPAPRVSASRRGQYADALAWMGKYGVPLREAPGRFLAGGGIYLNVSQFPLGVDAAFRWLDRADTARAVFFIHDLLPLETPEFFRPAERPRHLRRLKTLARYGAGAIVSTGLARESLRARLRTMGRADMPVLVAPLPVDAGFASPCAIGAAVSRHPYFVSVGTIEPRKNHLTLLHVWRELMEAYGAGAPKLLFIGERGWENEQVMDLIERCPALKGHVILASGLATPVVRRLIAGARALLAPSFQEGYGLPVAEGLAAGVAVIASDIPVFREIAGGRATLVDPIDGPGWKSALLSAWRDGPPPPAARSGACGVSSEEIFARVEDFLDRIARGSGPA